jgi:DNA-binding response OmpR family regulator
VSKVLLLTSTRESAAEILPSLSLLDHVVRIAAAAPESLLAPLAAGPGGADGGTPDAVLVDARRDLVRVKQLLAHLSRTGIPLLVVISEGAWAAITPEWGADDVILQSAGPGEVEARIRLAIGRFAAHAAAPPAQELTSGELVIDEVTYSARISGTALDLTFKEFELLKFLAQHPRRVFTRSQLLQEVWGYDYFGGTRTVDVHVRRLRAKLGTENEALIGTVRNVGYKFVPAKADRRAEPGAPGSGGSVRGGSQQVPAPGRPARPSRPGRVTASGTPAGRTAPARGPGRDSAGASR